MFKNNFKKIKEQKRFFLFTGLLIVLSFGISLSVFDKSKAAVESITGYAWSPNIGFIDMSGVSVQSPYGPFSGYAWSPNVGWISFNGGNDISGCNEGGNTARRPEIQFSEGGGSRATGFARVMSAIWNPTPGFNGCINLEGPYGVKLSSIGGDGTSGAFSGYAWGDRAIGWVNFDGVFVNIEQAESYVTLSAYPAGFTEPGAYRTDLLWRVSPGMEVCNSDGGPWSLSNWEPDGENEGTTRSGSFSLSDANPVATFWIKCVDNTGQEQRTSTSVYLTTVPPPPDPVTPPVFEEF